MSCVLDYKGQSFTVDEFKDFIVEGGLNTPTKLPIGFKPVSTVDNILNDYQKYSLVKSIDKIWYDVIDQSGMSLVEFLTKDKETLSKMYNYAKTMFSEKLNSNLPKETKELIQYLLDNWDQVQVYHARNSETFSIKLDQDDDGLITTAIGFTNEKAEEDESVEEGEGFIPEDTNQELNKKTFDHLSGNQVSSIDGANKETRSLVRSLTKLIKTPKGEVKTLVNEFGFEELVDFYHTWNNIALNLQGIQELPAMISKLNQLSTVHPEYKQLVSKLTSSNTPLHQGNVYDTLTKTKFRQDFSRTFIPLDISVIEIEYDTEKEYDEDVNAEIETIKRKGIKFKEIAGARNNERAIESLFVDNFTYGPLTKHQALDSTGSKYLTMSIFDIDISKTEGQLEFLESLGVVLSPQSLRDGRLASLPSIVAYFRTQLRTIVGYKPIYNPMEELRRAVSFTLQVDGKPVKYTAKGESANLNALIQVEAQYNTVLPTGSIRNAEGEIQYALSTNNFITIANYWLNNPNLDYFAVVSNPHMSFLDYRKNPNVKNSVWLNEMFNLETGARRKDASGNIKQINIKNISGVKIEDPESTASKSTTRLNIVDKELQDFNTMLRYGHKEMMRAGDKSTAYSLVLDGGYLQTAGALQGKHSPHPVAIRNFIVSGTYGGAQMVNIMNGYLIDELVRIKNFHKEGHGKHIKTYNKLAGDFNLFKDDSLLPPKVKALIKKELLENGVEPEQIILKYSQALEAGYNLFFHNQATEQYNYFKNEYNLTFSSLEDAKFVDSAILSLFKNSNSPHVFQLFVAYNVNSFITNVEQTKIYNGDSAFFKDFHKRNSKDNTTGKTMTTDSWFLEALSNDEMFNYQARSKGYDAPPSNVTKTVVFKDVEFRSIYIDVWKKEFEKEYASDPVKKKILDSISAAYENVNEVDGQGFATLDFYRTLRLGLGNWTAEQEKAFRKASLGQELEVEEMALFTPMKIKYAGPLKTEHLYAPAFHKFSIYPLIPQVIKGKYMEEINEKMLKQNVGYALFESGSKVAGQLNEKDQFEPFYKDYKTREKLGNKHKFETFNLIYNHYIVEQVNIEPAYHDSTIFGTQFRKLLFQNLFSGGKAINPRVEELNNNYISTIKGLVDIERARLVRSLGLEEGPNKSFTIVDQAAFRELILQEAFNRNLNKNVKEFFLSAKEGDIFRAENSHIKQHSTRLLMGMINRRLIRQKMNGDLLVQISSGGLEPKDHKLKNATEEQLKEYGSNGLRFYHKGKDGKVKAAQIKLALSPQFEPLLYFKHDDGEIIGTLDRLNEMLKSEKWINKNRKAITVVGYRIPTQGPNSMDFFEVQEFLPMSAGSVIITPPEMTAKSGSDFDIDKMSLFFPNFNVLYQKIDKEDGTVSKKPVGAEYVTAKSPSDYSNFEELKQKYKDGAVIKAELAEFYAKKEELINKIKQIQENPTLTAKQKKEQATPFRDELRELKEDKRNSIDPLFSIKKALQNNIIEIATEVLGSDAMYLSLIRPNGTDMIKELIVNTKNPAASIKVLNGFSLNTDFVGTDMFTQKTQREKTMAGLVGKAALGIPAVNNTFSVLFTQMGLKLNNPSDYSDFYNPFNGNTDLSNPLDENGESKSEFISQLINAYVDVLKDDFIFYGNGVKEITGMITFLKHMGVGTERIFYYINHPVVKYYLKQMRSNNSLYIKLIYPETYSSANQLPFPVRLQNSIKFGISDPDRSEIPNYQKIMEMAKNPNYFTTEFLKSRVGKNFKDISMEERLVIMTSYSLFKKQSERLRLFQATHNNDTKPVTHPMEASLRLYERSKAIEPRVISTKTGEISVPSIIPLSATRDIYNKTIVGAFALDQEVVKMFAAFYPVSMSQQYRAQMLALYEVASKYRTAQQNKTGIFDPLKGEAVFKPFMNDLVLFSFLNFTKEGLKFISLIQGENSAADRLEQLKKDRKDLLAKYPVLNQLRRDTDGRNKEFKNIKFLRPDDSTPAQDSYISQIEEILQKEDASVVEVITDVLIVGFGQQGLSKGPFGMFDIIPTSFISPILDRASSQLKAYEAKNGTGLMLTYYSDLFKRNNSKLFGDFTKADDDKFTKAKKNRFKNYYINDIYKQLKDREKAKIPKIEGITFKESPSANYNERTETNAALGDATIAFATDFTTAGEVLTKNLVLKHKKKYIPVDANSLQVTQARVDKLVELLNSIPSTKGLVLNIAGNGLYTMKGKYTQQQVDDFTYALLSAVIASPKLKHKIRGIVSGGQTGFDEAGAKAALRIGLPAQVTAPKGWRFRPSNYTEHTGDTFNELEFKKRFVLPATQGTQIKNFTNFGEAIAAYKRGEGIWTMRPNKDVQLPENQHFGNIWSSPKTQLAPGTIVVPITTTVEAAQAQAAKNYKEWLLGTDFLDVQVERRNWIREQIRSGALDNKQLIYYKPTQYYSHADALAELVQMSMKRRGVLKMEAQEVTNDVNYELKATNIIKNNYEKINKLFSSLKNTDTFWNKLQQDYQIPKNQLELLKDQPGNTFDEKLTNFLASYSFTVEINIAKKIGEDYKMVRTENDDFEPEPIEPEYDFEEILDDDGNVIDMRPVLTEKGEKEYADLIEPRPTHYYENLTVPGGTNYTENEISTPAIIPNKKGHAQFSTDNGIGWFRSDDQVEGGKYYPGGVFEGEMISSTTEGGTPTKTRRILEVQSDLFQKERGKENLVKNSIKPNEYISQGDEDETGQANDSVLIEKSESDIYWEWLEMSGSEYEPYSKESLDEYKEFQLGKPYRKNINKNQFLQLLNKDNNWVTFFVKSIIQDSAKKGYEKVLFPSGNTANKVEGQQTLEDFIKLKEDRIKELENQEHSFTATFLKKDYGAPYRKGFNSRDEIYKHHNKTGDEIKKIESNEYEIARLTDEVEQARSGRTKFAVINKFYETDVYNILKKQGYNPQRITDEYDNTWNEVDLSTVKIDRPILLMEAQEISENLENTKNNSIFEGSSSETSFEQMFELDEKITNSKNKVCE